MEEKTTKKREWVKNAAIIFLTVMLLLTFFSNTIMNYSLPEVATQYVVNGSITAKVRGTGTITASDPYNVAITESRKISSVAVQVGAEVQKGDVLFSLEDSQSTELLTAQKALEDLELAYQKSLLDGTIDESIINKVESGNVSSTDEYKAQIEKAINAVSAAQAKTDACQATVNSLARAISLLANGVVENTADTATLYTAFNNLVAAKATLTGIQNTEAYYTGILGSYSTPAEAATALTAAETALTAATTTRDNAYTAWNTSVGTAEQKAALLVTYNNTVTAYNTAKTTRDTAAAVVAAIASNDQLLSGEQVKEASAKLNVANLQAVYDAAVSGLNAKKTDADSALTTATAALTAATTAKTNLIAGIQTTIGLSSQSDAIATQKKVVDDLLSKSVGATVTAPVTGTVTAVNFVAGQTADANATMAVIQMSDKGFTLEFSVTNDQAKNVSVGDVAEAVNAWYYSNLTATLSAIKADPSNPGKSKLLHFDISGDVTGGQSLSLSVGQKSADYDLIVPNSAIREDNNGKFILIVESKSSPLGNRYIATRVDVEVLASDDTQTAISGALYGSEYVITTSTKPVEAGKQVRLAEQ